MSTPRRRSPSERPPPCHRGEAFVDLGHVDAGDPVEVMRGLGDTDIVGGGRWIVPFVADDQAAVEGALIPDYPTKPANLVVLPGPRDVPIFAVNRDGGSVAVHVAADLDAAYARHGYPDHGLLLRKRSHDCVRRT